MKQLDKIREKIGDVIKESFPFYVSYNLNKNTKYGQDYELEVKYYYMGEQVTLTQFIPINALEREYFLTRLKDLLLDVRKDLISYPKNETQQEFLRKERQTEC